MYLKNFDLTKYNDVLYWISNLCVSNKNVIINNALINADAKKFGLDNVFILDYDAILLGTDTLIKYMNRFRKEENIRNVFVLQTEDKTILRIIYNIPKCNTLDYNIRVKHGLKYETPTSLKKLMLFWGEYNSFHI